MTQESELERVERVSKKSIQITLVLCTIMIICMVVLGWIMLNNSVALAKISQDLKEKDEIILQLQNRVEDLNNK